jgi:YjbE family integral membrane protein
MAGATALLVIFAGITTQLLKLVGLLFAGGVLLLWVCWKMWRELRATANQEEEEAVEALTGLDINADGTVTGYAPRKTLAQAAGQIIIADLSMSLDNVLAVAGAAREHPVVLIFGLSLSILLMGVAARFIASLLHQYRWIAYLGLAVILYVALGMVFRGAQELTPVVSAVAGLN